ncbi:MAG: YfhO family protein [Microthrixaceae bacterium]
MSDHDHELDDAATTGHPLVAETRGTLRQHLGALVWFALVASVFLAPLFGGRSFSVVGSRQTDVYPWTAEQGPPQQPAQFDSADLSHPWQLQLQAALDEGTLPFWSPDIFDGGAPLYANGTAGQLYPPRLLAAMAPERWSHDLYVAIHLIVGGLVAYLLCREFKRSALAGVIAGTAWMLGSFNLAWAHLEVVTSMMVALPLGPLLVHRMWRKRTVGSMVATACGFAVMIISGHLLWQLLGWLIAALYAAALGITSAVRDWRSGDRGAAWGHLWRPPAAFALGGALSAVVLVPTLINLTQTPRKPFSVDLLEPFETPAATFTTEFLGGPSFSTMTTEVMNYRLAFVGTAVALLAVVGFFSRRQGSGLARTIMVVTAGVATVGWMSRLAYELVPGMNVFYPYGRLAGWFALGAVLGAALGFDTLVGAVQRHRPAVLSGRWAVAAPVAGALVCALTVVQLVPLGRDLNPPFQSRDDSAWFPDTPLLDAARAHQLEVAATGGRVAPIVLDNVNLAEGGPSILRANHAAAVGLDSTSGYDSTLPLEAAQTLRVLGGLPVEQVLAEPLVGAFVPNLELGVTAYESMRSQGITAVVTVPEIDPNAAELAALRPYEVAYSGPDGNLLTLGDAPGVVSLHGALEVLDDDDAVLEALPLAGTTGGPIPTSEQAVADSDGSDPPTSPDAATDGAVDGTARIAERGINSLEVEVELGSGAGAEDSAWLLVGVNEAPGWTATIDGERLPIVRANHSHMAVPVDGSGTVEFRYRPPGLLGGLAITLLGAALSLALLAGERGRRRLMS